VLLIFEALLLALNGARILPESEVMRALKDTTPLHENAGGFVAGLETHEVVATLVNRIIAGGTSVRRPKLPNH
jgi:hypothetical protein